MEAGKLYQYCNVSFDKFITLSPNYRDQEIFRLKLGGVIMFLGVINRPNAYVEYHKVLCPNGLVGWINYRQHEWDLGIPYSDWEHLQER